MSRVLLDMSLSVDGFVSGPNGEDGGLHDWYFSPTSNDTLVSEELFQEIGAMVIGRKLLGDPPEGFDTPYKVPHFVLTHTPRPTQTINGVPFIFLADGITGLLAQAQAAAGEKLVCIAGGATTAQQFLNARLVDEVHLHMISRFLGDGLRLFSQGEAANLERTRVLEAPGVTHLRFRVIR